MNRVNAFVLFMFVLIPTTARAEQVTTVALNETRSYVTSWYGHRFEGRLMKNGQPFRASDKTTAAHRTLPIGTKLRVTNPHNGRTLTVTVKDRGPYIRGRDLDLSLAAAEELGYKEKGVTTLMVVVMK